MKHIGRLGNSISVRIEPDEDGYIGRECPDPECESYFKVTPGTGLPGDPPCHCPYCGHTNEHKSFFTKAQIEYVKSVAMQKISGAFLKDLKTLEFDYKPKGPFGIGLSMKVEGRPSPIRYYREERLETEVVCEECTLRYMIYGVFGFCPDCGVHNSLQIFNKNLKLVEKQVALALDQKQTLAERLVENALEDCVSSLDGFGREVFQIHASKSLDTDRARNLSFQNISRARQQILGLFEIDIAGAIDAAQWSLVVQCFQKRHLLAHKMGVVDQAYIKATKDSSAIEGRKVQIKPSEVANLVEVLKKLATYLVSALGNK